MPDTEMGQFGKDVACSDCGEKGEVTVKHYGPLVPLGKVGFFDRKCFDARVKDSNEHRAPRPLGQQST